MIGPTQYATAKVRPNDIILRGSSSTVFVMYATPQPIKIIIDSSLDIMSAIFC